MAVVFVAQLLLGACFHLSSVHAPLSQFARVMNPYFTFFPISRLTVTLLSSLHLVQPVRFISQALALSPPLLTCPQTAVLLMVREGGREGGREGE